MSYHLLKTDGGGLEVAGDPVRLAQLGGAGDHPRELGQRAQQLALELVREQRRVEVRPASAGSDMPRSAAFAIIRQVRAWPYCT